jgi:hypothetical protein
VSPFKVDLCLLIGDVNGDGRVNAVDVSCFNGGFCECDLNGDARYISLDAPILNMHLGTAAPARPTGHTCSP